MSETKKGWFVHVPRTGGTTINKAIDTLAGGRIRRYNHQQHRMAWQLEEELGVCRDEAWYSFGFVRNPWDRLVSFFYLQEQARLFEIKSLEEQIDWFEEWFFRQGTRQMCGPYRGSLNMLTAPDKHHHISHPMWLVDGVFQFEGYLDAWQEICNKHLGIDTIELGHENKSIHRPRVEYQRYYRKSQFVDLVAGWCWWEVRIWKYQFE